MLGGLNSIVDKLQIDKRSRLFLFDYFKNKFRCLLQQHIVISFPCRVHIVIVVVPAKSTERGIAMASENLPALSYYIVGEPRSFRLDDCRHRVQLTHDPLGWVSKIRAVLNIKSIYISCRKIGDNGRCKRDEKSMASDRIVNY